jgi:hypothetical protein
VSRLRSLWRRWRRHRSPYLYDWAVEDPELTVPPETHVRLVYAPPPRGPVTYRPPVRGGSTR